MADFFDDAADHGTCVMCLARRHTWMADFFEDPAISNGARTAHVLDTPVADTPRLQLRDFFFE
jgi:hypothetical protein